MSRPRAGDRRRTRTKRTPQSAPDPDSRAVRPIQPPVHRVHPRLYGQLHEFPEATRRFKTPSRHACERRRRIPARLELGFRHARPPEHDRARLGWTRARARGRAGMPCRVPMRRERASQTRRRVRRTCRSARPRCARPPPPRGPRRRPSEAGRTRLVDPVCPPPVDRGVPPGPSGRGYGIASAWRTKGLARRSAPMVEPGPCPQMKATSSPNGSSLSRMARSSAGPSP